jgi:peptide/nickel transport system substrate-binding protein
MNQLHDPFGRRLVREAVAYGLERAAVVRDSFVRGATVAREFTPPGLAGYAAGVDGYQYDPVRAKALLRRAGLRLPVRIDLSYPTGVRRPYLPDPEAIARRFAASLERSGFRVELRPSPWLPDYLRQIRGGGAGLFLLGWIGDYADAGAFLDPLFGTVPARFGFLNRPLGRLLRRAKAEPDQGVRAALYRDANRSIMRMLPGVPFVSTQEPVGLRRSVRGFVPSPLGIESYARVSVSGR